MTRAFSRTVVRSWRDYGRLPSREAQHEQPEGPAIWDREHNEASRAETDRLFRELFGIADGEESATIKDGQGEEVSVSMRFLDHMRGAHKRDGAIDERRTQFTPLAKATIQAPFEVWMVPHRRADGSVVMRKRYIGLFSGRQDLVVVERGDDGYAAWTAMPSRNLDAQRQGYLLYPR